MHAKREPDRILPVAPLDRLIRTSKADRVSEGAAMELGAILESLGRELAERAADLARHANRATVKDSDIRLAFSQWHRK